MSSRPRVMGASFAGASKLNANVHGNTGGGVKKQGIVSRMGLRASSNRPVQIKANGTVAGRARIILMNQRGGIGVHSLFVTR